MNNTQRTPRTRAELRFDERFNRPKLRPGTFKRNEAILKLCESYRSASWNPVLLPEFPEVEQ